MIPPLRTISTLTGAGGGGSGGTAGTALCGSSATPGITFDKEIPVPVLARSTKGSNPTGEMDTSVSYEILSGIRCGDTTADGSGAELFRVADSGCPRNTVTGGCVARAGRRNILLDSVKGSACV